MTDPINESKFFETCR